jgi:putative phage-type endonuclease
MPRLRQGTPEWLEARRSLVTSTDIPVLLGLSPWKCEADLADEKLGNAEPQGWTLPMEMGTALQGLIGEYYSRLSGRRIRPVRRMWVHPDIEWAAASPDFRVVGERRLVEAKYTNSRTRFIDGLPQDVEAQVQWALGVSGFPVADVAVLHGSDSVSVGDEVRFDERLFADLVAVANNFRYRLAAGGPFSRDAARIRRDYPQDDGTEMVADDELAEAVLELLRLHAAKEDIEKAEERIQSAVQARMGEHARLVGPGFTVRWKTTKDIEKTDWKSLAGGLLRQLPNDQRDALVSVHTAISPGRRPFYVVKEA